MIVIYPSTFIDNRCNKDLLHLFLKGINYYGSKLYDYIEFPRVLYIDALLTEFRTDLKVANVRGLKPVVLSERDPYIDSLLNKFKEMKKAYIALSSAYAISLRNNHDLLKNLDVDLPLNAPFTKYIEKNVATYLEWSGQLFMEMN